MVDSQRHHDTVGQRRLPLRKRPDLLAFRQWYRRRCYWVLKDPVALKYFHLRDEEYAILQMLDGQTSLSDIQTQFQDRFAPNRVSLPGLQTFLGSLHQKGLIVVDRAEQSGLLLARRAKQRRMSWLESYGNVLAIRTPGIDPEVWLKRLTPIAGWLFSWPACLVWLAMVLGAVATLIVHAAQFQTGLSDYGIFFTPRNLFWLVVVMAIVKILHELGHATACQRFGGECHELGLMFLVFTPCLYCDVSDAWLLADKWRRIMVSAAGIYIEGFLFSAAALLWWASEPGLFNSLCLNTIIVCSVGTIVFNGNPLMRFDGYYIFADLIEVPNLRSRAGSALSRLSARWLLDVEMPRESALGEQRDGWLALYAVACAVYRVVVVTGIFLFLSAVLRPHRLQFLAQLVLLSAIVGMFVYPMWRLLEFLRNPLMRYRIQRGRVVVVCGLIVLLIVAAASVPLPLRVKAPVAIQWEQAEPVYVTVPGIVRHSREAGEEVSSNAILAELEDLGTSRELKRLTGERDRQKDFVRQLESRRGDDPDVAESIPAAHEALDDLQERLRQVRMFHDMLTLRAPVSGTVLAPPANHTGPEAPGRLPRWTGTPLRKENVGCYLEAGTLLCLVGDPTRVEAVAVIEQTDIELVAAGQSVVIRLDQYPSRKLKGTIREVAKIDLDTAPRALVAGGLLASQTDAHGVPRTVTTTYQARIALEDDGQPVPAGCPGQCKIKVAPRSLAYRLTRFLSRTFRFAR